jgi:hypothetical protein
MSSSRAFVFCLVLGVSSGSGQILHHWTEHSKTASESGPTGVDSSARRKAAVPWSQIGAKAGADYHGDGLAVLRTPEGARLRCVFQRLEGEATCEGLWLSSTLNQLDSSARDSFRIVAVSVGREVTACPGVTLTPAGSVSADDQIIRFKRLGLVEEYSVSVNGVRQDFVIFENPAGEGQLGLRLQVTGARVELVSNRVQLLLPKSGRRILYDNLAVTDAKGKELRAQLDATKEGSNSMLCVTIDDSGATYPLRIDPTFSDANWISMGGIPGADSGVRAVVLDDFGNLYVGGDFTVIGDVVANGVAKWDGAAWSSLASGMCCGFPSTTVYALAVSGGDLYAGGTFSWAGGAAIEGLARWDGTNWSALGSGFPGYQTTFIYSLAASGHDLYAGGYFWSAGGSPATNIAKWDGASWSPLGTGTSGAVDALALAGSSLYAGGTFASAGGVQASNIARWDGTSWAALGSGMDSSVAALALLGTNLYAGGMFTNAGGNAVYNIAEWDGNSWTKLGSGLPGQAVSAILAVGGMLYVGGEFTLAGSNATGVAMWDGANWSAVATGTNESTPAGVVALAISGSNLYCGGWFTNAGSISIDRVARWNGTNWSALGSGTSSPGRALAAMGNCVYAGGQFTTVGGVVGNFVGKWDGRTWEPLGSGMNDQVWALASMGGYMYAGGDFTNAGGVAASHIAKWDGTNWSAVGSGVTNYDWFSTIRALAVSGSNLYAGGDFSFADGNLVRNVAKWNGTNWSALGTGFNNPVNALAISGGSLYAGGWFTRSGTTPVNGVARWDGTNWVAPGLGIGGSINVFALASLNNNLYAGGSFNKAIGSVGNFVARWDGTNWSPLGLGLNNTVYALTASGGSLFVGGYFTTAGGLAASNVAKWTGTNWSTLGSGMGGGNNSPAPYVYSLAVLGNDLYAAGTFTTAGRKASAYIARAYLPPLPILSVLRSQPNMTVSWPSSYAPEFVLEQAEIMAALPTWVSNTDSVKDDGTNRSISVQATNESRFFRLRRQ